MRKSRLGAPEWSLPLGNSCISCHPIKRVGQPTSLVPLFGPTVVHVHSPHLGLSRQQHSEARKNVTKSLSWAKALIFQNKAIISVVGFEFSVETFQVPSTPVH